MNCFLKFPDKSTAYSILFNGETPCYKNIDVIGVIYKPTGVMLTNSDGTEYPETTALDGWHVNVFVLPDEDATALQDYIVTPMNPCRVWS